MRASKILITLAFLCSNLWALADPLSLAPDKVDEQKIFWGTASKFNKPGLVRFEEIIQATPEFSGIKTRKIEAGTAKYWIMLSKASERAVRVIQEVAQESQFDLVAEFNYWQTAGDQIPAEDITEKVLERLAKNK
ncbi:MAG TPA: hypothetical protein PLT82_05175 [Candidatus Hydrogenedens sp.]|nr:hypothetical protein [Candidatus Hydrogenedens sp.]HOL18697.1 hypothetical protein [Candidatus Hydrogenedens sp.]HPP58506.1 hypothetical protein [Candidatus Hydrogenedens sp.]